MVVLTFVITLAFLLVQRTERKRLWIIAPLTLIPVGYLIYKWAIYRNQTHEVVVALGISAGLNLLFMVNETRGTLASIFECVNSFADLTVRRTAPYPDEIAARIDTLLAKHRALDWAAPVCGVMSA